MRKDNDEFHSLPIITQIGEKEDRKMPWVTLLLGALAILLALLYSDSNAVAAGFSDARAINAIIGEAEGEGSVGMEAVACAIRNRGTLSGVYGEKAPRVIKKQYSEKTYYTAKSAWVVSESQSRCDALIHGATHWEGTKFKTPAWARGMIVTATIRNQRFYKER